jgi:hypothetical protein
MTNTVADIAERVFELVNAGPISDKKLYSKLAVEFIHFDREEIHKFVDTLIGLKVVIRVDYKNLSGSGSFFFSPETQFEFRGRP